MDPQKLIEFILDPRKSHQVVPRAGRVVARGVVPGGGTYGWGGGGWVVLGEGGYGWEHLRVSGWM